jgi:poly(beta-D-mannuronate) lyase
MNGIPDSPAAGYFQVKRATIAFNTFIDCRSPFLVGYAGSDPKKASLPPRDGTIAGNLVVDPGEPFVKVDTEPQSTAWRENLVSGADGPLPAGFRAVDPKLARVADGMLRPSAGAAGLETSAGGMPPVADDIDGQPRGARTDAGCDQRSDAPGRFRVLRRDEAGPDWMRSQAGSRP